MSRPPRIRQPRRRTRPTTPGARSATAAPPRHGRLLPWVVALALAGITGAAYAGVFGHEFVNWDDRTYVVQNPMVLGKQYGALLGTVVSLNYHPLTMWTLAANVGTPLSPLPFLATNVALHVVNTLLVFWLALLLSSRRLLVAAFTALLFGIHPMHVESVAWISERKDVLYLGFFLGGLIAYWYHQQLGTRRSWWLSFALFLLSCLSKGMAVVFPLVMVLLDLWRRRPLLTRTAVLEKLPFLAVALLFGIIAVDVQSGGTFHGLLRTEDPGLRAIHSSAGFPWWERVSLPTYGYLMYVWRLLVPVNLCAAYPYPRPGAATLAQVAVAPLFLVGTLALAIWDARRTRLVAFGILWTFLTVALVLQWLPVGKAIMADRYSYLPYVGLGFLWGMGADALRRNHPTLGTTAWVASGSFLAVLFALTVRQVETWKDSESLWTHVIDVHPDFDTAYAYRGRARSTSGRIPEAMADLQTALRLGYDQPDAYAALGSIYGMRGQLDSSLTMFDQAVRRAPDNGHYRYIRGFTYVRMGRLREGLADLDRATASSTAEEVVLQGALGEAHLNLGEFAQAQSCFDRAIAADARDAGAFYGRGVSRLRLGDRSGASDDFRQALRLDPSHAEAKARLRELGIEPAAASR